MQTHMKHAKLIGAAAAAAVLLAGCSASNSSGQDATTAPATQGTSGTASGTNLSGDLQIYAAASLKNSFTDIITAFNKGYPDVNMLPPVYDGSSTLVTQILEGAPVDVFASADEDNMKKITDEGYEASDPTLFASNDITIAVEKGNPKGITGIQDLTKSGISVVVCAPEVPCGAATQRLFTKENVSITPVSEEQNVTSVATKVANGDADAGLIYQTDVEASDGALEAVDTPVSSDITNYYPITVLKASTNPEAAKAFVDFVLSDQGQEILKGYGFGQP